ncbi:MAG TPA: thiamine pyrophosphate-dependent dehydrogenase E1 component subunit alpha [Solirubrobacterales bacterium]|nr:thiamine pyrophosphate-dependent dehydrogenase E1 component subunit alpha [Solirubrobacterales bacterium]
MSPDDQAAEARLARYRRMRLSRRFEETVHEQFEQGNVPGPLHLSIGQEAVAVGACAPLRRADAIVSTHRGHHHCIAKGAHPDRMMAELLGRATGYSRGRGGSMHIAVPELGILGTNGIVGGGIPIATGAAFGFQVEERDDVCLCFFGEGAAANGVFGEALNTASLWKLPLVMLCENNVYVEMTHQSVHVAGEIWRRAEGYDMPGVSVDGNDVDLVAEAVAEAVARARAGGGPTLVEARTYRWLGHFAGDKAAYRDEVEVAEGRAGDPLPVTRAKLDPALADGADEEVEGEIAAALEFALQSPLAGEDVLAVGHYAELA